MKKVDWKWNRQGLRVILLGVLVAGLFVALAVHKVRDQYRVFELGQELSEESRRYTDLNETQRKLRLETSAAKKVEDIRSVAEEKLGMKIPQERDYIVVTQ